MPWAKRVKNLACCIFCREEFLTQRYRYGYEWCHCRGADAEKKRIKNAANRAYFRQRQSLKGLEVKPHGPPKKALKPSEDRRRKEVTGVYQKQKINICKRCGSPTVNRFNCTTCLVKVGDIFDLSIAVEAGYSRHIGYSVSE
jgi:hypothetical protein